MKTLVIIFFLALATPFIASNGGDEKSTAITVSARVLDKHGEALPGAKIVLRETGQTVYSDFEGLFKVQLDRKRNFTFQIDLIGFEPKVIPHTQPINGELILKELE